MPQAPFTYDADLTTVAMMVPQTGLISGEVLPAIEVDRETFSYLEIPSGQHFKIPETLVGARGVPNQVLFHAKRQTGSVEAHALQAPVVQRHVDAANAARSDYDPRAHAVEGVAGLMDLRRESSMATLVFNENNYDADKVTTLSGTSQWSDAASDPVRRILTDRLKVNPRPNVLVLGDEVATYLRLHNKILQAFHANDGGEGVAPLEFLARLLGFERVVVGEALYDPTGLGEDASLTRLWGKHAAMHHVSRRAWRTARGVVTLSWGADFFWPVNGRRRGAFTWFDPEPGINGEERIKLSEQYVHKVVNKSHGYFYKNAVA